jgi:hypothetical protein
VAEQVLAERHRTAGRSKPRHAKAPAGEGAAAAIALSADWQAALPPVARKVGRAIGIGLAIAALEFVALRLVRH